MESPLYRTLVELVCGYFKRLAEERFSREFSEVKFIQYLMRSHCFLQAFLLYKLKEYFDQLEEDIPRMLMKDLRKQVCQFFCVNQFIHFLDTVFRHKQEQGKK